MNPVLITNASQECFNEDGSLNKIKYIPSMQNMTKHERKDAKKILQGLVENTKNKYYYMNIEDTDFGCVFKYESEDINNFHKEIMDTLDSVFENLKAFNYVSEDKQAIEVWGVTDLDVGRIVILYPYDNAVFTV